MHFCPRKDLEFLIVGTYRLHDCTHIRYTIAKGSLKIDKSLPCKEGQNGTKVVHTRFYSYTHIHSFAI